MGWVRIWVPDGGKRVYLSAYRLVTNRSWTWGKPTGQAAWTEHGKLSAPATTQNTMNEYAQGCCHGHLPSPRWSVPTARICIVRLAAEAAGVISLTQKCCQFDAGFMPGSSSITALSR